MGILATEVPGTSAEARPRRPSRLPGLCVSALVLWLLDVVVWLFIRGRGAGLSGDEPHYLVLARMLAHGSLHPLSFYQRDVATHALYNWPPGSGVSSFHLYQGAHGLVSVHGLGLPLLLAPFVALAGRDGGIVGMMAIEAVGWVYLFTRATDLVGLRRPARVVTLLAMAGPAVWIASSQLYPDFISGLLIAIAVVDIATFEKTGRIHPTGVIATGLSLGLLPWLHIKNAAPAAVIFVALCVVAIRSGKQRRATLAGLLAVPSWLALLIYNLWAFGRMLGFAQPTPVLSRAAFTQALGLLFDRHQGLVIQVPVIILGVAGLWMARRVVPLAVAATGLAVVALVYLNATYVSDPYGGTAVAGRFSWEDMAPLLLWVPFFVVRLQPLRRLWALGGTIIVCWALQAIPIVTNHHVYYNAQNPSAPWDPSLYPGWWGPLNNVVPELVPKGPLWGSPSYAFVVAIVITAAVATAAVLLARDPPVRLSGWALLCAASLAAIGGIATAPLPAKSVVFPGRGVGSPLITGSSPTNGASVPLLGVGPGTYTITVHYRLTGRATVTGYCTRRGAPTSARTETLDPQQRARTITVSCPSGIGVQAVVWFRSAGRSHTRLVLTRVVVRKTRGLPPLLNALLVPYAPLCLRRVSRSSHSAPKPRGTAGHGRPRRSSRARHQHVRVPEHVRDPGHRGGRSPTCAPDPAFGSPVALAQLDADAENDGHVSFAQAAEFFRGKRLLGPSRRTRPSWRAAAFLRFGAAAQTGKRLGGTEPLA